MPAKKTSRKSSAKPPEISLVVPMYNEQEAIDLFLDAVKPIMKKLGTAYEIICVNDGSSDQTLDILQKAHKKNKSIKIIDLSRNFGKEIALTAGIDHARGQAVIPIDCDLQDPPELIIQMVEKWREGFDMVLAIRQDRSSDGFMKRLTANGFYALMSRIAEVNIPSNAGDFRLMDRRVVEALGGVSERTRFMKGIFAWLGFKQTSIYYTRAPRAAGETKWKPWQLWNFAIEGIVSFTSAPLKIWTYIGVSTALLAILYMFFVIIKTLIFGVDVPGYASIISVILLFSGLNMLSIGILGEYLCRVYIEVKKRPLYLVRETIGLDTDQNKR